MTNLNGSEKQINWANEIRTTILNKIATADAKTQKPVVKKVLAETQKNIESETEATWFITNNKKNLAHYCKPVMDALDDDDYDSAIMFIMNQG